jgi:hypothetical protein
MDGFQAARELIIIAYLLADDFRYAYLRKDWGLGLG